MILKSPFDLCLQGVEKVKSDTVCQSDKGGSITGGDGFSTKFPRPSWQDAAVASYITAAAAENTAPVPG